MIGKYVMVLDGAKNSKFIKLGVASVKVTKKDEYQGTVKTVNNQDVSKETVKRNVNELDMNKKADVKEIKLKEPVKPEKKFEKPEVKEDTLEIVEEKNELDKALERLESNTLPPPPPDPIKPS